MSSDRIVKNTTVLYLRTFVTLIISLFTARITLDVLGIDDWGLYNVVGGFVSLLAFVNSSLGLAAQRFLTTAIAKEYRECFGTFNTYPCSFNSYDYNCGGDYWNLLHLQSIECA